MNWPIFIVSVCAHFVAGLIVAVQARERERSVPVWFMLGFVFGIFTLLYVFILDNPKPGRVFPGAGAGACGGGERNAANRCGLAGMARNAGFSRLSFSKSRPARCAPGVLRVFCVSNVF